MSALTNVQTILRERYQRAAMLDADGQLQECIDYLQHPEILVAEFADSYLTASEYDQRDQRFWAPPEDLPRRRLSDDVCDQLVRASQIRVLDDPEHCFRYVASEIFPLRATLGGHREGDRRAAGLDYVGLISQRDPVPVLGVVHVPADRTLFLSLMRALTCLAEVATEPQVARANRFLFRGVLPAPPVFDLHLLAEDPAEVEAQPPVSHLTRELAHVFNVRLRDEWQFPNLLRHIYCLRMRLKDFDGSLRVDWRS